MVHNVVDSAREGLHGAGLRAGGGVADAAASCSVLLVTSESTKSSS